MSARAAYLAFLGLLAAERMVELALSARHRRQALARGAIEVGSGHYPLMVAFHAAFLLACALSALWRPTPPPVARLAALGVLAAQVLRWWAIATLGERWNTRILVIPGEPPVTGGPYRWLRHPNYLAVVLEVALVPLAWGAWPVALAFSLGNVLLLAWRISVEERALGEEWAEAFEGRPRWVPVRGRVREGEGEGESR